MNDTIYAIDPYSMETGDTGVGLIYIRSMSVKPKRNGGVYGDLEGYYKGKTYPLKVWHESLIDLLRDVKFFIGKVRADSYNGSLQVTVETVELTDPDGVDETFFFDSVDMDKLNKLKDEVLSQLGEYAELFNKLVEPFKSAFYSAPAARNSHDNIIGGLAYHSFKTADLAIYLAKQYGLDVQFIGFCALVHDIGKVVALSAKTIDYTPAGMVQGHISLGIRILTANKQLLDQYMNPMQQHILYGVVENHHGKDFGGTPTTLEAWLVHYADITEATLTVYSTYTKQQIEMGETGKSTWFHGGFYFVGGHELKG